VKRALEKDGWSIVREQFFVGVSTRNLWIDIQASKNEASSLILVEVKGFESSASVVEQLSHAIGQYMVYRAALRANSLDIPLYLAVPLDAYGGIFNESLGIAVLEETGALLMVFDPVSEEVIQWIP
jgi:hypothetical protein